MRFLSYDTPFGKIGTMIFDLIWLQILVVLTSIPLITVGILLDFFLFNQSGICTYVLGGLGLLFYVYSIVLSVLTLKTEKKAQQRAYAILKANHMATAEELEDLEELFHLYNIQYINDIILACLELLYTLLQIALALSDNSSD
jgi:Zn-dependent membrane protease YugP